MKKKQLNIQLSLILVGLLLILGTYFYYPLINEGKVVKDNLVEEDLDETPTSDQSTSFENVEYKGLYDLNKPFTVQSEKAYILNEDPDLLYMTKMHVILHLSDGRTVHIVSDKGMYNKSTFDCFFQENVEAKEGGTVILADNLDLLATRDTVEIYNNVDLDYIFGSLLADKIDYNFEKKKFKISMFDKKKIKIKIF